MFLWKSLARTKKSFSSNTLKRNKTKEKVYSETDGEPNLKVSVSKNTDAVFIWIDAVAKIYVLSVSESG